MQETDIITYEPGFKVAVRAGYVSRYGVISRVSARWADVTLEGGEVLRFSRETRRQHGWKGTNYDCPYLATVAVARAKDADYDAARRRAAAALGVRL